MGPTCACKIPSHLNNTIIGATRVTTGQFGPKCAYFNTWLQYAARIQVYSLANLTHSPDVAKCSALWGSRTGQPSRELSIHHLGTTPQTHVSIRPSIAAPRHGSHAISYPLAMSNNASLAAPLVVENSGRWLGNDGTWSAYFGRSF